MNKLYDLVFKTQENKKLLYFKGNADITEQGLCIAAGNTVDFLTYFNSFSVSKWKEYTNIKKLQINGNIVGYAEIEINTIGKNGKLLTKQKVNGNFSVCFDVENISGEILGIKVKANIDTIIQEITYLGEFTEWKKQKIGVVICTYKREKYVQTTIDKLVKFSNKNPWLTTLVVDNGATLKECENDYLRIIPNPNYGGSGGFTRGIIENLKNKTNDYVLLMDDDIDLDTSVLKRTYSLVSALKDEYRESFVAGAMLNIDDPYIQYENTAYWNRIKLIGLGKNFNLSQKASLINNVNIKNYTNQYAAWWYCCIPVNRIEMIGLPLPFFIKGDDIEYSIRNDRKIIFINSIAVWHEPFTKKTEMWINYFSDRNMLILNFYAANCNALTFFVAALGRLVKRCISNNYSSINILYYAINDVYNGFEKITEIAADKKLRVVQDLTKKSSNFKQIFEILWILFIIIIHYKKYRDKYIYFRNYMNNKRFWENYYIKANRLE